MSGNFIILSVFLAIVAYYDIRYNRIPNWLNVSGVLVGIIYNLLAHQIDGLLQSVGGLFAGGIIMLILYIFKALGAGDVKMFAAIGAITGVLFTLYSMMYTIIFAGILALIILVFTKTLFIKITLALIHIFEAIKKSSLTPLDDFKKNVSNRFPFIYAVIPGVIVAYYYMYIVQ